MEITLNELVRETGFPKRQILGWYKQGILPDPVQTVNTGRESGRVLYFSEEALYRLRSIQNYPVSKLTKTMGLDALAFLLFMFGFNDEKLREKVRSFLNRSVDYFIKSCRKGIKEQGINELLEVKSKDELFTFYDIDSQLAQAMLSKMMGVPKRDVKEMVPEDTSNGVYDFLSSEEMQARINVIKDISGAQLEMDSFLELYTEEIQKFIPNIISLKNLKEFILKFKDRDFQKYQFNLLILINFFSGILGQEKIIYYLREKIVIKNIMGLVLISLYWQFITTKIYTPNKLIYEEGSVQLNKLREQSGQPHIRKKKVRKTKEL